MDRLDVIELTAGKPFTAGAVVLVNGRLVVTLNRDHLPPGYERGWLRVGGVGGGQEPGETIDACAAREAREELGTDVEIVSSPVTYLAEADGSEEATAAADPAPLLVTRTSRPDPSPFAPGLPAGHDVYGGIFLARAVGVPVPSDDVAALLLGRPADWPLLTGEPTIAEVVAAGVGLIERDPLPPETRLWVHPEEAWELIADLLARHPELEPLLA
jgi:8-oxo-dGTP pyrophosphatase MutT (NUDIX family)